MPPGPENPPLFCGEMVILAFVVTVNWCVPAPSGSGGFFWRGSRWEAKHIRRPQSWSRPLLGSPLGWAENPDCVLSGGTREQAPPAPNVRATRVRRPRPTSKPVISQATRFILHKEVFQKETQTTKAAAKRQTPKAKQMQTQKCKTPNAKRQKQKSSAKRKRKKLKTGGVGVAEMHAPDGSEDREEKVEIANNSRERRGACQRPRVARAPEK
ncbi:uncharacterized protein SPSK_05583 [Sporothrix schenckii 1099-18]|uniref:Uncharacterized protein n=1 Tax=Sporothrix schenckii 1099-18 TaxID=1397361 RepID=A0A0F2LX65_SPOSC|nr:uncharacterized protein SPSK_05583 [Sporothrix schenckii 1099-18]KJR80481.1 hypothetical protein SPSK_05583 [Sporothrix schenckii 1099-18]